MAFHWLKLLKNYSLVMSAISFGQIYIDPILKQDRKKIVFDLEESLVKHGFLIQSRLEKIDIQTNVPCFFFLSKLDILQNFTHEQLDKVLVFHSPQSNLDLFECANMKINFFDLEKDTSVTDIVNLLLSVSKTKKINTHNIKLKNGEKKLKSIVRYKDSERINNKEFAKKIFSFEQHLFLQLSLDKTKLFIKNHSTDYFNHDFSLYNIFELEQSRSECYIPLEIEEEKYLYLAWNVPGFDVEAFALYSILKEHLSRFSLVYSSEIKRKDLEIAVSLIPLPIALFDSNQLLVHNKSFLDLNISSKQCLGFTNHQQFTKDNETFRVIKKNLEEKVLFSFISVQDVISNDKPSSEELGIITSSVAHELNNPLAGILAGLEVILLDDLEDELTEKIKDMQLSVNRCKKLVETFLGFSKLQISPEVSRFVKPRIDNIEFSLGQAMELVRFRLIENNVSFHTDFLKSHRFEASFSGPMMTMIFYLILGDIVTNMAHHSLVIQEKRNLIKLYLSEEQDKVILRISEPKLISFAVVESKLFSHLVESQGLKYILTNNSIKFLS